MKKAMSLVLVLSLALTILVSVAPSQSPTSALLDGAQMTKVIGGTPDLLGCGIAVAGAALFIGGLFVIPGGGLALALYAANAIVSPTAIGYGFATQC